MVAIAKTKTPPSRPAVFQDDALAEFASRTDSRARRSVIIEVDVGPVRVKRIAGQPRGGLQKLSITRVAPAADPAQALRSIEHELQTLHVAEAPVVLDDAKLVVATLTPAQLRKISGMREVARIRSNVKHTVKPKGGPGSALR